MATVLGVGVFLAPDQAEAYQDASTPTGVLVTIVYDDFLNVRSGPGTYAYPTIGTLAPGDVVAALGVSPGRDWIQIAFPGAPDGKGWVSSSPTYVSVSGGELMIVEPPPTPVLPTVTTDPTLAAAFSVQPTATRMPTFTPPPPLTTLVVTPETAPRGGITLGFFIVGLGVIGALGLLISFVMWK